MTAGAAESCFIAFGKKCAHQKKTAREWEMIDPPTKRINALCATLGRRSSSDSVASFTRAQARQRSALDATQRARAEAKLALRKIESAEAMMLLGESGDSMRPTLSRQPKYEEHVNKVNQKLSKYGS
jgi:uncharacterized alpha-E superfamily protein